MNSQLGRIEIERALMSAAVVSLDKFAEVELELQGATLRSPEARSLWPVICSHANTGHEFDFVEVVGEAVVKDPALRDLVTDIFHMRWEAAHIPFYAAKLRAMNVAEDLRSLGEELRRDDMPDIDEYLTRLDNLRPNTPDEICTAAEAIAAYRLQKVNPAQTHSTGIDGLNRVLKGGCRDGQLVVIGGRPGTGKSVLMLQFAVAAAATDKPALVVSLEMPRQEIAGRLAARFGESRVAELPVNFLDTTSNLDAIAALVKVQHRRKPLGMLVVDYLQLLDVKGNRQDTRQDRIAAASRTLKRLAMDLQIPVIAGSQLNRDSEKRGKPTMADLRESGAIEQDADVVILISVDRDSGESELDVCKHRGGATGRVSVELDGPRFQFSEKIPSWVGAEEKWG